MATEVVKVATESEEDVIINYVAIFYEEGKEGENFRRAVFLTIVFSTECELFTRQEVSATSRTCLLTLCCEEESKVPPSVAKMFIQRGSSGFHPYARWNPPQPSFTYIRGILQWAGVKNRESVLTVVSAGTSKDSVLLFDLTKL
ncbi:unnamed protein product, partial [Porites evermanni]